MAKLKEAVEEYSAIARRLDRARESAGIGPIEEEMREAEANVKTLAREASGADVENAATAHFRIRVDRPFRKIYNVEMIRKWATKDELKIIENEALVVEVKTDKFEELVTAGMISRALKQRAFREEPLQVRVSIVRINGKGKE